MFRIYPGPSIWWKRIFYTVAVSSIGINLFINAAQNHLFDMTREFVSKVDSLLPIASTVTGTLEFAVPILQKIESKRYGKVASKYGMPQSHEITSRIKAVEELEKACKVWEVNLDLVIKILRYTSLFMWFPLMGSLLWIYLDLKKGQAKLFTLCCLIMSLLINIKSYEYLASHFSVFIN